MVKENRGIAMKKDLKTVELAVASAEERIESAKKLLEIKNFSDAVSRAYYSVLDIARAALILKGEMPKTHAGTIAKFNQNFIKSGEVDKKYGTLLSKLERARTEADYQFGVHFTKEETEETVKEAQKFVAKIKEIIGL